jgi:S-adenosylmethionine:tRNA ribosyltransferase-isomerase
LKRRAKEIEHKHFYDIIDYLRKGDVLVLNNSKVFPARLKGKRQGTGGRVEVFLLKNLTSSPRLRGQVSLRRRAGGSEVWQCLVGGPRRKIGLTVEFGLGLKGEIIADNQDGTWQVKFNQAEKAMMKIVEKIGQTPLPPYIKRISSRIPLRDRILNKRKLKSKSEEASNYNDNDDYQTVYADDKKIGSVAAPTAGFHFTPALLRKIEKRGVQIEYITLHVGLGTFAPVKVDDITKHKMHAEYVEINKDVMARIRKAKLEGRRIIAVGTTTARTLETAFKNLEIENCLKISARGGSATGGKNYKIKNFSGWVDIFIYPGYKYKVVDALITNFHLPKSTLLMLVSALAGQENIKKTYKAAISKKYRFYSYGDAMFIC